MLKMFVLTNSSARYASKNLSKLVSENPDLGGKRTGKLLAHFMNVVADSWATGPLGPMGLEVLFSPRGSLPGPGLATDDKARHEHNRWIVLQGRAFSR